MFFLGDTVLHLALKDINEELTIWILQNTEIDVQIKNNQGETAFDLAASSVNYNLLQKMVSMFPSLFIESNSFPQKEQRRSARISRKRVLEEQKEKNKNQISNKKKQKTTKNNSKKKDTKKTEKPKKKNNSKRNKK